MRLLRHTLPCLSLFSLLFLLCPRSADAQSWVKTFGGPRYEEAYNVYPTADGGFITAGTQRISQTEDHFWVARFDAAGTMLWDSTYGNNGTTYTLFGSGTTRDGGLLFGGFTGKQFSGTEEAVAYSIDSTGKERWFKGVDYNRSDHFHSMIERKEGGYYLAGHTDSKTDPNGNMWLLRLDSERNVIWEQEYDHNYGEHVHWAIETRDGGALLFGHGQIDIHEKYWLVKVDSNGTKQWDSMYSSDPNYHDSPYHLFETREGNYAMVGGSQSDEGLQGTMWLLVVDTLGRAVVDKHYSPSSGSAFAWSGRQTSDGGYILAGYALNLARGDRDMYIVKTDSNGVMQWDDAVGGEQDDDGYDVIETEDAYIAVGSTFTTAMQTGGGGDMLAVRIAKMDVEPPATPQLISPPHNSTGLPTTQMLTWTASPGATGYTLQIGDDSLLSSSHPYTAQDNGTPTASILMTGLEEGHRYWWTVLATSPVGTSYYSERWSFVVGQEAGVNDNSTAAGLNLATLSPNPARSQATLTLDCNTAARVEIRVTDGLGRLVQTLTPGTLGQGRHLFPINTEALAGGIYHCIITVTHGAGQRQTRRIPLAVER